MEDQEIDLIVIMCRVEHDFNEMDLILSTAACIWVYGIHFELSRKKA